MLLGGPILNCVCVKIHCTVILQKLKKPCVKHVHAFANCFDPAHKYCTLWFLIRCLLWPVIGYHSQQLDEFTNVEIHLCPSQNHMISPKTRLVQKASL